jgi:hypothetical protein
MAKLELGKKIYVIGELRELTAHLDSKDQICIEGLDTDLYPMYVDIIEGIQLTDGSIVREVRFCQMPNTDVPLVAPKTAEKLIKDIDWSELRNQKQTLIKVITELEIGFNEGKVVGDKTETIDDLNGILALIDAVQDYAVDNLGISEMNVLDFELEEQRDAETPEELFARENAEIIFQIRIEGEGLYMDDDMSEEFIKSVVDNKQHASAIKNVIRQSILNDVHANPNDFNRDDDGKLTYDYTMYDYGFAIETYCREIFNKSNIN